MRKLDNRVNHRTSWWGSKDTLLVEINRVGHYGPLVPTCAAAGRQAVLEEQYPTIERVTDGGWIWLDRVRRTILNS
jgi:hypothetical protein